MGWITVSVATAGETECANLKVGGIYEIRLSIEEDVPFDVGVDLKKLGNRFVPYQTIQLTDQKDGKVGFKHKKMTEWGLREVHQLWG